MTKADLAHLAKSVAESPLPVVIYPEGTRTRDGRIARFKRAGISAVLLKRQWTVRVVTIDGYWQLRSLSDFLTGSSAIEGRMTVSGALESPDPEGPAAEAAVEAFVAEVEGIMRGALAELRSGGAGELKPGVDAGQPGPNDPRRQEP